MKNEMKRSAIEFVRFTKGNTFDEVFDVDKYIYFLNVSNDESIVGIEKKRIEFVRAFENSSEFKRIL